MRDFKERVDKLLADANDCELIGNLAVDATKRATFRRLATQFRTIAAELKAEAMDGRSSPPSNSDFLLRQAQRCRDLAASMADENVRTELQRLAAEFEAKAREP